LNLQQHLCENLKSYITHNLSTAHVFVIGPKTIFFWAPAFKWVSDCVKKSYLYEGWCYFVTCCHSPKYNLNVHVTRCTELRQSV